jgi:hypothetical protein
MGDLALSFAASVAGVAKKMKTKKKVAKNFPGCLQVVLSGSRSALP